MNKRDLLNFDGMSRREFDGILQLADELKRKQQRGIAHRLLAGKQLAMVFEKPSLRTRATFDVGMIQLGGSAVYLGPAEVGLGTRETPADCARNLRPLVRSDHGAHLWPQDHRRDGRICRGAGDQRAHRWLPSVPGARRLPNLDRA